MRVVPFISCNVESKAFNPLTLPEPSIIVASDFKLPLGSVEHKNVCKIFILFFLQII